LGAGPVYFYVQTEPIAQNVAADAVSGSLRRGTGRWGAPLAAVAAFVMAAGVSGALTVSRIDHSTAATDVRPAVASLVAVPTADFAKAVQEARG
jgi:hypothetical protein